MTYIHNIKEGILQEKTGLQAEAAVLARQHKKAKKRVHNICIFDIFYIYIIYRRPLCVCITYV